jgi:hypothetical protein
MLQWCTYGGNEKPEEAETWRRSAHTAMQVFKFLTHRRRLALTLAETRHQILRFSAMRRLFLLVGPPYVAPAATRESQFSCLYIAYTRTLAYPNLFAVSILFARLKLAWTKLKRQGESLLPGRTVKGEGQQSAFSRLVRGGRLDSRRHILICRMSFYPDTSSTPAQRNKPPLAITLARPAFPHNSEQPDRFALPQTQQPSYGVRTWTSFFAHLSSNIARIRELGVGTAASERLSVGSRLLSCRDW